MKDELERMEQSIKDIDFNKVKGPMMLIERLLNNASPAEQLWLASYTASVAKSNVVVDIAEGIPNSALTDKDVEGMAEHANFVVVNSILAALELVDDKISRLVASTKQNPEDVVAQAIARNCK